MSFGKRQTGKSPMKPAPFIEYGELPRSSSAPVFRVDRLLVLSVVAIVGAAALTSILYGMYASSRREAIPIEAALIDGSPASTNAQDRLVNVCIEHEHLKLSPFGAPSQDQQSSIARTCACTFAEIASGLTPLQSQMLYVDQRNRVRATMAEIDRTGERIALGGVPRVEARDGAAIALIAADRYDAHWREARDRVDAQAARCKP